MSCFYYFPRSFSSSPPFFEMAFFFIVDVGSILSLDVGTNILWVGLLANLEGLAYASVSDASLSLFSIAFWIILANPFFEFLQASNHHVLLMFHANWCPSVLLHSIISSASCLWHWIHMHRTLKDVGSK